MQTNQIWSIEEVLEVQEATVVMWQRRLESSVQHPYPALVKTFSVTSARVCTGISGRIFRLRYFRENPRFGDETRKNSGTLLTYPGRMHHTWIIRVPFQTAWRKALDSKSGDYDNENVERART